MNLSAIKELSAAQLNTVRYALSTYRFKIEEYMRYEKSLAKTENRKPKLGQTKIDLTEINELILIFEEATKGAEGAEDLKENRLPCTEEMRGSIPLGSTLGEVQCQQNQLGS